MTLDEQHVLPGVPFSRAFLILLTSDVVGNIVFVETVMGSCILGIPCGI